MTELQHRRAYLLSPGLLLSAAGLVATAPALAAPTPHDCAAASEESLSLRKLDKLSAAKERLLVCADAACPAEIRDECAHHLTEVTDAIPSVVFDVKDAAGNDVSAVRVTMDGALLVDHLGAAAVSIDPGEHAFHFDGADASQSADKKFVIRDGEKNRHLAVAFGSPGAAAPPLAPTAPVPSPPAAPAAPAEQPSSWSGQKTVALIAGGAGIIGIGVGSAFGIMAMSSWSNAKSECGGFCSPSSQAETDHNSASSQATISTVGFIAGGVLVAGAAVLWFTAPSGAQVQVSPSASTQGVGMTIRGTF